ncbi:MAG TPA: lysophospholipid acyltransferase family protein [Blastocatellia bacterium]|jgi:lysophospholipid acyltransferase (LPLAT)-like uncharacterized protein|nr:lysophospholipid acyltransferase family protein [Blastocatellia bacterium]
MQSDGGAVSSESSLQTDSTDESSERRSKRRRAHEKSNANVEELRRRVYEFSDLSSYSLRDRLIIRAADVFFYLLIRFICSTLRWEKRGADHLKSIHASGHRAIFTFWHEGILAATWFWRKRGIVVMSSLSRDAEYTARVIKRFGYGTARGSSTRGGARAMAEMAACLMNGMDVSFTIDGPRGPALVAKPGAVTLARHTGQAILPFHIAVRRLIEIPSWDRLQIPLPFTRAIVLVGEPIYVARDASNDEIASKQAELQSTLERLRSEAHEWRTGKRKRRAGNRETITR